MHTYMIRHIATWTKDDKQCLESAQESPYEKVIPRNFDEWLISSHTETKIGGRREDIMMNYGVAGFRYSIYA